MITILYAILFTAVFIAITLAFGLYPALLAAGLWAIAPTEKEMKRKKF